MNAIIYLSISKKKHSKTIAHTIEGDYYELLPGDSVSKCAIIRMVKLGFATLQDKQLSYIIPDIDFQTYDNVYLVFPIWAGKMAQYMKCYLQDVPFTNKNVTLIATSDTGKKTYALTLSENVGLPNHIVGTKLYKKNTQIL